MKKILHIISVVVSVAVCVSCSEPESRQTQDYTSFVFIHNFNDLVLPNCVAGYYADGLCHKIANLGDMTKGKYTPEITLEDDAITEIRLFTDYFGGVVFRRTFQIAKNKKNVFELREDDYSNEVDINDPSQYPH